MFRRLTIDFLESKSVDNHPKVIQEGQRYNHVPMITQTTGWIKYKRPFRMYLITIIDFLISIEILIYC